jgi:hypothetical protein
VLARSLPPPWKTRKEDAGQVRPPVTLTPGPAAEERHFSPSHARAPLHDRIRLL